MNAGAELFPVKSRQCDLELGMMGARVLWAGGLAGLGLLLGAQVGLGQQAIVPDGTLGVESSQKLPIGATDFILGGARRGNNLFHSFEEFGIEAGRSGLFIVDDLAVQNILARVTGTTRSEIFGTLGTAAFIGGNFQVSPANLFLINPNGIIFGQSAQLDVGASFAATTASGVRFGDQGVFSAEQRDAPPLLTVQPDAFLFTRLAPAGIEMRANAPSPLGGNGFRVNDGQRLLLLGGDVAVDGGGLIALGGRVEVGAVAAPGTVLLGADGRLGFADGLERGNVTFESGAVVQVDGIGGGDIGVTARDIEVSGGSLLRGGIFPGFGTPDSRAGTVRLDATGTVTVAGASSRVANDVRTGATGRGGDLEIEAGSLVVRDGAALNANTFGKGDAGNVRITARDRVLFQNQSGALSTVSSTDIGKGGNIEIETGTLEVLDGAILASSTLGTGDSGDIVIRARDRVLFQNQGEALSNVLSTGIGKGGNIEIKTGTLEVLNGAALTANTFGKGDGGNVRITASDRILFQNGDAITSVENGGLGRGGTIDVQTNTLTFTNGGQFVSATFGEGDAGNTNIRAQSIRIDGGVNNFRSGIFNNVENGGVGKGGTIDVETNELTFTNGGQFVSATFGQGDAGNTNIRAQSIRVDGGFNNFRSGIFNNVENGGVGRGGTIDVQTNELTFTNGGQFASATFGQGDAGNTNIRAQSIRVDGGFNNFRSGIFNGVENGGVGRGGTIDVETNELTFTNGGQFASATFGQGDAGNVLITASDRVVLDGVDPANSRSSAIFTSNGQANDTIGQGRGGNVIVTVPLLLVSNGAVIDARTANDKSGGNITLNLGQLTLLNGGQILSTSDGSGPAGTVRLNATDGIRIAGSDPTYGDRLAQFGDNVAPITANSGIYVRSTATGAAGNVIIGDQGNTPRLILDGGEIVADSNAVNGGNISLNLNQALVMRNGSLISATAGRAQGAGDGGNITIAAPFVLSRPGENNDIIANAFSGTGGNITITADSILNFTVNDKKDFATLRAQPTNDISASSQLGTQGVLNLVGLNVDPSQGAFEFPGVFNPPDRIRDLCKADGNRPGRAYTDKFVITGRGGMAETPFDTVRSLPSDPPPWITLTPRDDTAPQTSQNPPRSSSPPSPPLKEATSWRQRPDGVVELVAEEAIIVATQRPCDLERLEQLSGSVPKSQPGSVPGSVLVGELSVATD